MSMRVRWLTLAAILGVTAGFVSFHGLRRLGSQPDSLATAPAIVPAPPDTAATGGGPGAGGDLEPSNIAPAAPVPDQVPAMSLPDLQGRPHALTSYRGRPTILNFWASWCAPCRLEIPLLNEIRHDSALNGTQVIGIAADLASNVAEFMKHTRIDYEVLVGEREGSEVAARFGVPLVLPFSVFVAASGKVVAIKIGELHRDEATALLAAVRDLDLGKRDMADTRLLIAARLRELAAERARATAASPS